MSLGGVLVVLANMPKALMHDALSLLLTAETMFIIIYYMTMIQL